jgi:hypothetical protein
MSKTTTCPKCSSLAAINEFLTEAIVSRKVVDETWIDTKLENKRLQAENEKLKALLEEIKEAQTVYGRVDPADGVLKFINDPNVVSKTHKAKLLFPTEIKQPFFWEKTNE